VLKLERLAWLGGYPIEDSAPDDVSLPVGKKRVVKTAVEADIVIAA